VGGARWRIFLSITLFSQYYEQKGGEREISYNGKFCIHCHFRSNYEHFHPERKLVKKRIWLLGGGTTEIDEWIICQISDGIFSDENQICLPCQTMGMI